MQVPVSVKATGFTVKWRDVPQAVIPLPPYGVIEVTSS
jgi:hypothetical protein